VRLDNEGRFVDEDINTFREKKGQIAKMVDRDYIDSLRTDGLTKQEWVIKEQKDRETLEQLVRKRDELVKAEREVQINQRALADERQKIDDMIQDKMRQADEIKREFEQRAIDRAEAERKAAEERAKQEEKDREEEK
jgi:hypothetical protein